MIFVDTNVWMYAVGGHHPLRDVARAALRAAMVAGARLVTSAEVLQELLHAYLPVGRRRTLSAAMTLATSRADVVALEPHDVALAADLDLAHPGLGARDLIHLAVARRLEAVELLTYDRRLSAAFGRG